MNDKLWSELWSILRGAGVATGGAVLAWVATALLPMLQASAVTPGMLALVVALQVLVNVGRKLLENMKDGPIFPLPPSSRTLLLALLPAFCGSAAAAEQDAARWARMDVRSGLHAYWLRGPGGAIMASVERDVIPGRYVVRVVSGKVLHIGDLSLANAELDSAASGLGWIVDHDSMPPKARLDRLPLRVGDGKDVTL
jgi:hypothetical protein